MSTTDSSSKGSSLFSSSSSSSSYYASSHSPFSSTAGGASGGGNLATGLVRKLKKILDTRTDSPELLSSLSALSSFYQENSAEARKLLRSDIEFRGLSISRKYLEASREALQALDEVEGEVLALSECCDRISLSLRDCVSLPMEMISVTERLRDELSFAEQREKLVKKFLSNFQLSQEEVKALRENEIGESFFHSLSKVRNIHSNCKRLLRTHHQRAGLELMDVMSVYQEGAYERLCRWLQSECKRLGDSDFFEISPILKQASQCLRQRPVLFKYCAEEVANSRHHSMFRRFITALTRGGGGEKTPSLPSSSASTLSPSSSLSSSSSSSSKPIEIHAHEPLRYVGDMLAWLHQAAASERDLITSLFGHERGEGNEGGGGRAGRVTEVVPGLGGAGGGGGGDSEEEEDDAIVLSVLERIFSGVCRPLKLRLEQVISSSPSSSPLLSFELSALLSFYSHTVGSIIGHSSSLCDTIRECLSLCDKAFLHALRGRGEKLLRYATPVPPSLTPPPSLSESLLLLLDLSRAYERLITPAGETKPNFAKIVDAVLEPIISMCERSADSLITSSRKAKAAPPLPSPSSSSLFLPPSQARLRSAEGGKKGEGAEGTKREEGEGDVQAIFQASSSRLIFLLNCFSSLLVPLCSPPMATVILSTAQERVKILENILESHTAELVQLSADRVLSQCLLSDKLPVMRKALEATREGGKDSERGSAASAAATASLSGDPQVPLLERVGFSSAEISECLRLFFLHLANAEGFSPEVDQISLPRLRSLVLMRIAGCLSAAYECVYQCIMKGERTDNNSNNNSKGLLRHSPDQMRTILGIEPSAAISGSTPEKNSFRMHLLG